MSSRSAPTLSFQAKEGGGGGGGGGDDNDNDAARAGAGGAQEEKSPEELVAEEIARVEAMKNDPVYPRGRDPLPRPPQPQMVGKRRMKELRLAAGGKVHRDARQDLPVSNAMEMLKLRLRTGGQKWKPPGQR